MDEDHDIDSFDFASQRGEEDDVIDSEDYLGLNEGNHLSNWTRFRYWFQTRFLSGSRDGQRKWDVSHGIPLYELDSQGHAIDIRSPEGYSSVLNITQRNIPWRFILRLLGVLGLIGITVGLVVGSVKSNHRSGHRHGLLSSFDPYVKYFNGTHEFYPLTVMVSLDGFHPSLISKEFTPFLYQLYTLSYGENITSAPYMIPSFPSQTFPNHWSLVTGEYPKDHGIVSNVFWDSELAEEFHPGLMDPYIWANTSEPIWQVLQSAFVNADGATHFPFKVATHMWPGSDVNFTDLAYVPKERMPYYIDQFNGDELLETKIEKVLKYVDIESIHDRPQLILSYLPQIDAFGHKNGYPMDDRKDTKRFDQFIAKLGEVDTFLQTLIQGIEMRNLSNFTNVVIVSDHGMSNIEFPDNVLIWEDLLASKLIKDHIVHAYGEGPMMAITTKDSSDINEVYQALKQSLAAKGDLGSKFKIYLNGKFPERFHFNDIANSRIAPIWIIPEPGYAIMNKAFYKKNKSKVIGNHGYDNHESDMRSLFIGMGPFFERGYVEPFENVEIFDMLCDIFGVSMSDRFGDLKDTYFYKKFINGTFDDDFEYLRLKYGNGTAYNLIWGGEVASVSTIDSVETTASTGSTNSIETTASTSSTNSIETTASTSSTNSIETTASASSTDTVRTTASVSTADNGNWFGDILEDTKEILDQLVDEIEELVNNQH